MRRAGCVGLGVLAVAGGWAVVHNLAAIVLWGMTPSEAFDAHAPPAAPDYADGAAWTALPDRDDAADAVPVGGALAVNPAADVFYVHPTSFLGPGWSGPVDDGVLNEATDRVATRIQASALNGCCAVYGPRYRQANGIVFVRPSADGARAVDLAYRDVKAAFEVFQARRGAERPFFVLGHSQGSVLAARLLQEEVAGWPAQATLVAAYLPGGDVPEGGIGAIGPCRGPSDVGCVAAWNTRTDGYETSAMELVSAHGGRRLCTNPLTWRDGPAPASANLGAVFLDSEDHRRRPGFADARCEDGWLRVTHVEPRPRDAMSQILDYLMGEGNLHPVELQLFYTNLALNADQRLAAWEAQRTAE
jgi:hypothetical protein